MIEHEPAQGLRGSAGANGRPWSIFGPPKSWVSLGSSTTLSQVQVATTGNSFRSGGPLAPSLVATWMAMTKITKPASRSRWSPSVYTIF